MGRLVARLVCGAGGSIYLGSAVGLMLRIVAVGGAAVPPLYGLIASTRGYGAAWGFEGIACLAFALVAFLAPAQHRPRGVATSPVPLQTPGGDVWNTDRR